MEKYFLKRQLNMDKQHWRMYTLLDGSEEIMLKAPGGMIIERRVISHIKIEVFVPTFD